MTRATTRIATTLAALAIALGVAGCDSDPISPKLDPDAVTRAAVDVELTDPQRTALGGGIAHYTWDLHLGPGEFDVVRLHRVVMERGPYAPARTRDGLFMLPGSPNYWTQVFLPPSYSDAVPQDHSVAIYLARNGVDVWGIDYAWALVPDGTADFGFMRDWGFQRDVDFAYAALGAAQSIRIASGQGKAPLHLLGYSYGTPIAYAIAGAETLLPPGQRMAKGLVIGDLEFQFDDPDRRAAACDNAGRKQALIDAGTRYHNASGRTLRMIGHLADQYPDGHHLHGALTNYQFALFVGAVNPGSAWHFVAGEFNSFGIPTDLRFTESALWLDLMQQTPSYVPLQAEADLAWSRCQGAVEVGFDDHLSDITLPILDIDAAGGAGPGDYTASLTASADYQQLHVQLLSDSEAALDFGHADLFTASDADALVWAPLLDWLLDHRENRRYP